jgi:hypothetical protein
MKLKLLEEVQLEKQLVEVRFDEKAHGSLKDHLGLFLLRLHHPYVLFHHHRLYLSRYLNKHVGIEKMDSIKMKIEKIISNRDEKYLVELDEDEEARS